MRKTFYSGQFDKVLTIYKKIVNNDTYGATGGQTDQIQRIGKYKAKEIRMNRYDSNSGEYITYGAGDIRLEIRGIITQEDITPDVNYIFSYYDRYYDIIEAEEVGRRQGWILTGELNNIEKYRDAAII